MTAAARTTIESVTCQQCGHFIGLITSDGKGPILDECCIAGERKNSAGLHLPPITGPRECEMLAKLAQYQPNHTTR